MPAPRWRVELRGNFKKVKGFLQNAYVKFGVDNYFSQNNIFKAYGTETASPAYSIVEAGLGSDIVNKKDKTLFSIFIDVSNLTDVAYQNHLNRLRYAAENPVTGRMGVFDMGRNINIKVSVPLNFK